MNKRTSLEAKVPSSIYAAIVCTLPHFLNISPLAIAVCVALWGYTLLLYQKSWPRPGMVARTIAGLVFFLLAVGLHEGLTVEAFVCLLILQIPLKLFELRSEKDLIFSIIVCYFLIVASMFFNDSFLVTLYICFAIVFNTAVMIFVHYPHLPLTRHMGYAAKLSLQAIPLMLILFVIFPRVGQGLWGRPPQMKATTGFSNEVSLGAIAELAKNESSAFRVSFAGPPPAKKDLYWRGIVLWNFDGRTWTRGLNERGNPAGQTARGTELTEYTITLEPHNQRWLFTLDLPNRINLPRTWVTVDHIWYQWHPVTKRLIYQANSRPAARPLASPVDRQTALQLPAAGNEKSVALARQWQREGGSAGEIVELGLKYFRDGGFVYTLQPQITNDENVIDQFLFAGKRGFCEHFAASFALLMRAAGIPARLVGGYLGGTANLYGDYLLVKQSDAHVWVEVLYDGLWHRVDPTLAVAADRSLGDLAQILPAQDLGPSMLLWKKFVESTGLGKLTQFWDMLNMQWDSKVMGYSKDSQMKLFANLGIDLGLPAGVAQASIIIVILLAASLVAGFTLAKKLRTTEDETASNWRLFCQKMAGVGIERRPGQGPVDYMREIVSARPDLDREVTRIVNLYIKLRYRKGLSPDIRKRFSLAVHSFSPKPVRR